MALDIFEMMFENDEIWYFFSDGNAMLINDCQLLDY